MRGAVTHLYGRRVSLRPLRVDDFDAWRNVRVRSADWLLKWEPRLPAGQPDPTRSAKVMRRAIRAAALRVDPGDLSSLDDPSSLEAVKAAVRS